MSIAGEVNDLPRGSVTEVIDGKRKDCKFYKVWKSMFYRCYSENYLRGKPSYEKSEVCTEWFKLSNFKAWFDKNYREGYALDKDLLNHKVSLYSPDNCIFIPPRLNSFLTGFSEDGDNRGVGFHKKSGKYRARLSYKVSESCKGYKSKWLGLFPTEEVAILAYNKAKISYLKELLIHYIITGVLSEDVAAKILNTVTAKLGIDNGVEIINLYHEDQRKRVEDWVNK